MAQANNYVLFSVFGITKEWPGNETVLPLLGWFRHHDPSFFCCAYSEFRNAIELGTTCCSGRTFLFSFLGYFSLLFALLHFKFKSVYHSQDTLILFPVVCQRVLGQFIDVFSGVHFHSR